MMRNIFIPVLFFMLVWSVRSQTAQEEQETRNAAQQLMQNIDQKLTIGGYGQVDYNQPIDAGSRNNGRMDVHRLVLLFGYKFSDRVQFITEIEVEHVEEIYVEQAFVNYRIRDWLNFRAGLMLVPMGRVNEYHEPPSFNGVERPNLDYYIVPTTWREIGLGITGRIQSAGLKYQAYLFNGFISYDGAGTLKGETGLRGGRQKGAKAVFGSPSLAAKLEFYGIPGLNIGASAYLGKTQTTLRNGISKEDDSGLARADSSIIGVSMMGLDAQYRTRGIQIHAQYNFGSLTNTDQYNAFTNGDLGRAIMGTYLEFGYDIFHSFSNLKSQLTPFIRYENYSTHYKVSENLPKNEAYHREEWIFGLGWKPVSGVAFKADIQMVRPKSEDSFLKVFNAGIGVWF